MSWRDDTPEPVQSDLDLLADEALSAAQHLLEESGEFYPFAFTLTAKGTPQMAGADAGEGEHPASRSVLDLLYDSARAQRDVLKAAAFVAWVETPDGDAVRVEAEHRDGGPALTLLLPYRRKKLRKAVEFGQLTAAGGDRRVWV
jgi:hypothetical protein